MWQNEKVLFLWYVYYLWRSYLKLFWKNSVYFDLVPQSKMIFYSEKYRLSGVIFHHGETELRNYYIIMVNKGKKLKQILEFVSVHDLWTVKIFIFYVWGGKKGIIIFNVADLMLCVSNLLVQTARQNGIN